MRGRSCKNCNMNYEQEGFTGTILMCLIEDKQVEADSYCEHYRPRKK